MPPPPRPDPPAHTIRVACSGTKGGANWANVFWVRNGEQQVPLVNEIEQFTNDMASAYGNAFMQHFHTGTKLTHVQSLYYATAGIAIGFELPVDSSGALVGDPLPNQVACGISWKVQQHYKGGHPRTYLPAPDTDKMLDTRLWKTTFMDAVKASADQFLVAVNQISDVSLRDCHLGTVSFVLRNAWRTPPVFRDYSAGLSVVDARIDTQRRRLGRDL